MNGRQSEWQFSVTFLQTAHNHEGTDILFTRNTQYVWGVRVRYINGTSININANILKIRLLSCQLISWH